MTVIIIGALVIGLTLGMLGSGGSAITVPVLIYLVGHGTKESIAESMAIVGLISIAIAIPYAKGKQIDWPSVLYFGIPGMLGTYAGAWLGGLASETVQLIVFGVVLIAAARAMWQRANGLQEDGASTDAPRHRVAIWKSATEGTIVGVVTGFVGVGGGFLIVPALVVLGKLPMRLAIGTSLVIIAFKAAVGFAKYEHYLLSHGSSVDPRTILIFTLIGVMGSFLGKSIGGRMNQRALQHVFAIFLVLLGGYLMIHEGFKWARSKGLSTSASVQMDTPVTRIVDPTNNHAL